MQDYKTKDVESMQTTIGGKFTAKWYQVVGIEGKLTTMRSPEPRIRSGRHKVGSKFPLTRTLADSIKSKFTRTKHIHGQIQKINAPLHVIKLLMLCHIIKLMYSWMQYFLHLEHFKSMEKTGEAIERTTSTTPSELETISTVFCNTIKEGGIEVSKKLCK